MYYLVRSFPVSKSHYTLSSSRLEWITHLILKSPLFPFFPLHGPPGTHLLRESPTYRSVLVTFSSKVVLRASKRVWSFIPESLKKEIFRQFNNTLWSVFTIIHEIISIFGFPCCERLRLTDFYVKDLLGGTILHIFFAEYCVAKNSKSCETQTAFCCKLFFTIFFTFSDFLVILMHAEIFEQMWDGGD